MVNAVEKSPEIFGEFAERRAKLYLADTEASGSDHAFLLDLINSLAARRDISFEDLKWIARTFADSRFDPVTGETRK